jgi:hypothetical protein
MTYSELQEKGIALAKRLEALPMEERLNSIAQTFGCKTARVETSACGGRWRGYTDIYLVFDNGSNIGIGNYPTRQAKTDKTINECVNNTLARYHPDIVSETKELAAAALLKREPIDNAIAAEKGLKPYTFLNAELIDGSDKTWGGYMGWYYVTLAVDGKIFGHLDSGLASDVSRGEVSEQSGGQEYYVAGALPETSVDYVFRNVGFSSSSGLYHCDLTGEARSRAEKTLDNRMAVQMPPSERKPSLLGKLEQNKQKAAQVGRPDASERKPSGREV